MTREELEDRIRKTAVGNRLSCEAAHELSRELKVPIGEIGTLCNHLGIRISECRLGCF